MMKKEKPEEKMKAMKEFCRIIVDYHDFDLSYTDDVDGGVIL